MKYSEQLNKNYIDGRVYAITGAGGGFGRAVALEIVKMGGSVVLNDNSEERLNETMAEIAELGKTDSAIAVLGSCVDIGINKKMVEEAVSRFGKLDCFWANAGIMPYALMEDHEIALERWEACIDITLKGCLHAICASYDQFKAQGHGHFMVTSSIAGNWAASNTGIYSGCKQAVRYLVHSLRVENPGLIKVTVINPTLVASTNLLSTIVNPNSDQIGQMNKETMIAKRKAIAQGTAPELTDMNDPHYAAIDAEDMARSVMYALNQPEGISIGEITVRCTNEDLIS